MDSLEETDKFLEMYNLPSLNKEKRENINRLIMSNEIWSLIKKITFSKQKSRTRWFDRWIQSNIYKNMNTYLSQTTLKNCKGSTAFELILWDIITLKPKSKI